MAKNENHLNGILKYFGWFNEDPINVMKLSQETETNEPYYATLMNTLKKEEIVVEKLSYKNTEYSCGTNSCILIHNDDRKNSFAFGIITKLILKKTKDSEIFLLFAYQ